MYVRMYVRMYVCSAYVYARAHALHLTKLGERTFAQAKVAWQAAQDEFETQVGSDRAKALRGELFSLTAER